MRNPFDIDLYRLDKEWVEQPRLYRIYASKLTKAKKKLRRLEAQLDIVDAELDLMIRRNPDKYLSRVSEKAITNVILLHPRHQKAQGRVHKARHRVDVCESWVKLLDHRKKALENEVHLFGMNYFSLPRAKGKAKDRFEKEERKRAFKFSDDDD